MLGSTPEDPAERTVARLNRMVEATLRHDDEVSTRVALLEDQLAWHRSDRARLRDALSAANAERNSLSAELSRLRASMSYRLGALVVQGIGTKEGRRDLRKGMAGVGRDAAQALRDRRAGRPDRGDPDDPSGPSATVAPERGPDSSGTQPGDAATVAPARRRRPGEDPVPPLHLRLRAEALSAASGLPARRFVVAAICSATLRDAITHEVGLIVLDRRTWRTQVEASAPDLVIVEIGEPEEGTLLAGWHLPGPAGRDAPSAAVREMLEHCRRRGLPIVAWDTRVRRARPAAAAWLPEHADLIVTSTPDHADDYARPGTRIEVIPPASQPRLFHPFADGPRTEQAIVVGRWPAHDARQEAEAGRLLDQILGMGIGLAVIGGDSPGDADAGPPEKYRPFQRSVGGPADLACEFRRSRYGVVLDDVGRPGGWVSRHAYELMSCNTTLITDQGSGPSTLLEDKVVALSATQTQLPAEDDLAARRERALQHTLQHHTWAHRLAQLLSALGFTPEVRAPNLTLVTVVDEPTAIPSAVAQLHSQRAPGQDLLVALSDRVDPLDVALAYRLHASRGVGVVSVAYLRTLGRGPGGMATSHFALLPPGSSTGPAELTRGLLHASYLPGSFVRLGGRRGLRTEESVRMEDVMSSIDRLFFALTNAGELVEESCYAL